MIELFILYLMFNKYYYYYYLKLDITLFCRKEYLSTSKDVCEETQENDDCNRWMEHDENTEYKLLHDLMILQKQNWDFRPQSMSKADIQERQFHRTAMINPVSTELR